MSSLAASTPDQYLLSQMIQDKTGKQLTLASTRITEYQCMIIGSYGNQYSAQIKDKVVPKESSKPGGAFLGGVTDDLERVQEMVMQDHHKHLAYVLPDVPGAQRPRSHYISKIEVFLKKCQKSGGKSLYYATFGFFKREKDQLCKHKLNEQCPFNYITKPFF